MSGYTGWIGAHRHVCRCWRGAELHRRAGRRTLLPPEAGCQAQKVLCQALCTCSLVVQWSQRSDTNRTSRSPPGYPQISCVSGPCRVDLSEPSKPAVAPRVQGRTTCHSELPLVTPALVPRVRHPGSWGPGYSSLHCRHSSPQPSPGRGLRSHTQGPETFLNRESALQPHNVPLGRPTAPKE